MPSAGRAHGECVVMSPAHLSGGFGSGTLQYEARLGLGQNSGVIGLCASLLETASKPSGFSAVRQLQYLCLW